MQKDFFTFSETLISNHFSVEYNLLGGETVKKIIEGGAIKSSKGGNDIDFTSIANLISTLIGIFKNFWDIRKDLKGQKDDPLEFQNRVRAIVFSHSVLSVLSDDDKERLVNDVSVLLNA